jgi:phytoene desaturase
MNRAIVIGGGFGGIAAAIRLRAKGYDVELIDRCSRLGGRAQVFERDGYRHDAGPTVITAPFLIDELFALLGACTRDYVTLVPLPLWYRFRFPDGDHFDYGGTVEDTLAEIAKISPEDVSGYLALLADSEKIYDVGFTQLADKPFHKLSDMLASVPSMIRLGSRRTVWQLVSRHLKHDKLRQCFSVQPLLVGGDPFSTTSIYNLIHFLERAHGVHFAMGGTGALVDGLARLMHENGIVSRLNTTVDRVEVENGRVSGVRLQTGEFLQADLVVSNADPAFLYSEMLDAASVHLSSRLKSRLARKSMGLFVLFFGTEGAYPEIAHHTIWLGPRYRELLNDIFRRKVLADDFSLYLHRPTATDPSFAPEGHDSFYALIPVPNLVADIDWDIEGPALRERVINALDATILPDLKSRIRSDFFMTPEDFLTDYLSPAGAGFSIAPHFSQSAWFRFHNKAEGPENLFLVGSGTHPGAGLPGVLSSAKVLERLVPTIDERANRLPKRLRQTA